MAEAIISRRGYDAAGKPRLVTETLITNTNWTVPNDIRGNVSVRIFGGGGGGGRCSGGGGGWMNNGEVAVNKGETIQIIIGKGGNGAASKTATGSTGGTTSFGVYLSAAGGEGATFGHGGNGGSGGGTHYEYRIINGGGGTGFQFGGGGVVGPSDGSDGSNGGNGGPWGGGGGTCMQISEGVSPTYPAYGGSGGIYGGGGGGYIGGSGGTYGGRGGSLNQAAMNGTNTIGLSEVPEDCQGPGLAGDMSCHGSSGGGGYGGNGGIGESYREMSSPGRYRICAHGGGGGGYGGDGGNSCDSGGGGGGGYGRTAKGGDCAAPPRGFGMGDIYGCGGGGGYYGKGGNGGTAFTGCGGGGGGYGNGGDGGSDSNNVGKDGGIAAGGGGGYSVSGSGGDGICIIQYYI